ncbi:MAG: hypothetical protein PHQ11_11175 [Paludibacter sp.]|jgi:heme/copper-type cytochrome/quinol oxidase subunit 2|nr:hypothetical protein [Paludibacter sp.]MDD4429229.1 hypothetical protein [Paludibacter sp.]
MVVELVLTNISSGYLSSCFSSYNGTLIVDLATAEGYVDALLGFTLIQTTVLILIAVLLVYHIVMYRYRFGFR